MKTLRIKFTDTGKDFDDTVAQFISQVLYTLYPDEVETEMRVSADELPIDDNVALRASMTKKVADALSNLFNHKTTVTTLAGPKTSYQRKSADGIYVDKNKNDSLAWNLSLASLKPDPLLSGIVGNLKRRQQLEEVANIEDCRVNMDPEWVKTVINAVDKHDKVIIESIASMDALSILLETLEEKGKLGAFLEKLTSVSVMGGNDPRLNVTREEEVPYNNRTSEPKSILRVLDIIPPEKLTFIASKTTRADKLKLEAKPDNVFYKKMTGRDDSFLGQLAQLFLNCFKYHGSWPHDVIAILHSFDIPVYKGKFAKQNFCYDPGLKRFVSPSHLAAKGRTYNFPFPASSYEGGKCTNTNLNVEIIEKILTGALDLYNAYLENDLGKINAEKANLKAIIDQARQHTKKTESVHATSIPFSLFETAETTTVPTSDEVGAGPASRVAN